MLLVGLAILFAITPDASAIDGVSEINAAVVGTAFPYVITQPGSYRLTGNLNPPAGTDAIDINASNVTLDLNGFSIIGAGGSGGNGIVGTGGQVTVRNGTVSGMGGNGISLGSNAIVADVHVVGNGGDGIVTGTAGQVRHSSVSNNAGVGILLNGSGGAAIENIVNNNGGYGLQMSDTSSAFAFNTFLFNDHNTSLGNPNNQVLGTGTANQVGNNLCNDAACN
jgi:hypothetical protein